MEKILKQAEGKTYRAKDINWEHFECAEELQQSLKEYDPSGAILKEAELNNRILLNTTRFNYENGKLVKETRHWPYHRILEWIVEYDSEGNRKPYSCTKWHMCNRYKLTLDVSYDEYGRRVEKEYDEETGQHKVYTYEDGVCVLEDIYDDERSRRKFNSYDDEGRLIFEEIEEGSIFFDGLDVTYCSYDYDSEGNLLVEKIVKEEQREGEENAPTRYTEIEYIRESGLLVKKVEYICNAESIEKFINYDEATNKYAIEVTDYIRNEEVVESTPYMEGEAGPFVVRTVNELVDNEQMKKNIEIYSKDGDTLLKSIEATGHYNLYEATDDYMTVTETRYEYYE